MAICDYRASVHLLLEAPDRLAFSTRWTSDAGPRIDRSTYSSHSNGKNHRGCPTFLRNLTPVTIVTESKDRPMPSLILHPRDSTHLPVGTAVRDVETPNFGAKRSPDASVLRDVDGESSHRD